MREVGAPCKVVVPLAFGCRRLVGTWAEFVRHECQHCVMRGSFDFAKLVWVVSAASLSFFVREIGD